MSIVFTLRVYISLKMSSEQQASTSSASQSTSSSATETHKSLGDLRKQTKMLIYNVYSFLNVQKKEGHLNLEKVDLRKTQEATARICGVSVSSVKRITQSAPIFESPRKKYKREKPITKFDEFDKDLLRRIIFEFYDKKEYPTVLKLKEQLKARINYEGSVSSLRAVIREIGFRFRKASDGRKNIMERADISLLRINFLRKMHSLRRSNDDRPIFYLDETWINQNHSRSYTWQDLSGAGGLKVPIGKGGRLIICHVGSAKTGFLEGSKLIFRANVKSFHEDYHNQMNAVIFKNWFLNSFLNLLEEPSVIVMDNASYHSVVKYKPPNSASKKADIIQWLTEKNIPFEDNSTKVELLEIVKKQKPEKIYELDEAALERGHEVIRLPPYHCQYNPIELIWAQIKREVAEKNTTFKMTDLEKLTHQAIENVTIDNWRNCVRHAEELQEKDFQKEIVRDNIINPIIISLGDDTSSCSDFESTEE